VEGEFNRGEAKRSVLTVGQGRGFVVKSAELLLVIMAAHCLPHLPFADPAAEAEQRTYRKLLGLLGDEPTLTTDMNASLLIPFPAWRCSAPTGVAAR
jgi:hypothetical protein